MPKQAYTNTSAVYYQGDRRNYVLRPSKGSGSTVKIMDDLRSELVHEIVEQLNESRASDRAVLTIANTATARIALTSAVSRKYVEDVVILNGQTAALSNAATDIKIAIAAAGDIDIEGGPTSPLPTADGLLFAEGFGTNNFPAQSELKASAFLSTSTDALTAAWPENGYVLEAGQVLYAEVVNNEGAPITLEFSAEVALFDRLALQPNDYVRKVPLANRRFARSTTRSN